MTAEVVCFGEMLLRLNAPDNELLLQTGNLRVWVGGAEANVAVSLTCLGHATSMITVVPDSALGQACVSELRRRGVSTEYVRATPGRLGIYFMSTGAAHRPSEIIYDRADSAFAIHADRDVDWDRALQGAQWLHLSGITPALSDAASAATLRSAQAARKLGVRVSFDCNYRAKLWEKARRTADRVAARAHRAGRSGLRRSSCARARLRIAGRHRLRAGALRQSSRDHVGAKRSAEPDCDHASGRAQRRSPRPVRLPRHSGWHDCHTTLVFAGFQCGTHRRWRRVLLLDLLHGSSQA